MIREDMTKRLDARYFNLEYFGGQSPWYGAFISDDQHWTVLSSASHEWTLPVPYSVTGWVFDEGGRLIGEKVLCESYPPHSPITIDLREHFGDLPPTRGMIGIIRRPLGRVKEPLAPIESIWAVRVMNRSGVSEVIGTGRAPQINFPEKTGKRSKFRAFSGTLTTLDGWRSVAYIMNASANPEYSSAVRLHVSVFDATGRRLEADWGPVPAFGTAWVDFSALFGERLEELLAGSGGHGSWMIASDDGASIAYYLLYHPESGRIGGDHTRPLLAYVPKCYGAGYYTLNKPKLRAYLGHTKFLLTNFVLRRP